MKTRWFFAIMAALIVLTVQPVCSAVAARPELAQTEVRCEVVPIYEFTLPPNATVRYPSTQVLVGQFVINNLFLESDEQLSIELVSGVMAARTNPGDVLPYSVSFNPPDAVNQNHIGQGYGVVVNIDAGAFDGATRTVYDADLLFLVRSTLTGEVIWKGITSVTARKTRPDSGDDGDNGDGDNGNGEVVPDTGDNTIPDEEVPQAAPTADGDNGQPGINIPGEEVPEALQAPAFWWWWIPAAVLGAVLLLMLALLLLWRNVTVMIFGLDRLGQEELLRTISQLRGKRDEVIVALSGKQVRGGVSGMAELSEALTKRMRGKVLTVKVNGQRIFSIVIPADIDGRFQTDFDGWME